MTEFFPPRPPATPTIYAYASTHPDHAGLLKVGYTERNVIAIATVAQSISETA